MMNTKEGMVWRASRIGGEHLFNSGSSAGPDPDRDGYGNGYEAAASTWTRVCKDSSHIPMRPTMRSDAPAKTASPIPFSLQQRMAVAAMSTGQATVTMRKSRAGMSSPATTESFTGRVMKERLSRPQRTKVSTGSKILTSHTAGNSTQPMARPTTIPPAINASAVIT